MDDRRVLVVSDSHLSPETPESLENWEAFARYATQNPPDLIIHAGDVTLAGAAAEVSLARNLLDELPAGWVAVPGNHDIGDNPGAGGDPQGWVSEDRLERWWTGMGLDHWEVELGSWTLLGLNAQLFGSGLEVEQQQWRWLEEALSLRASRDALLVLHKPLTGDSPPHRFVPQPARSRLLELLDHCQVPMVVSGHVHQYLQLDRERRTHVWAPTSWAVLPDDIQETLGTKSCGILEITLSDHAAARMVEPHGLRQLTLRVDVAHPYVH